MVITSVAKRRVAHAGLPRDDVIFTQQFYDDILALAPELELTIMAVPSRPLPLKDTRDSLLQRLSLGLRQVGGCLTLTYQFFTSA